MRGGDTLRRDTLRFVLAAIKNESIARRPAGELDDAAVLEVLQRQAKMRRDSVEAFKKGDRPALAEKEENELAVILGYLPALLTEQEIREIAERTISEVGATGPRDMGKVMGKVTAATKDRADGRQVAGIVSELLKEKAS